MSLKQKYAVVDAQSILGLRPPEVELLPKTLRQDGLVEGLDAELWSNYAFSSI